MVLTDFKTLVYLQCGGKHIWSGDSHVVTKNSNARVMPQMTLRKEKHINQLQGVS